MKTKMYLLLLLLAGCAAPVRIVVDKDLDFNFSDHQRYHWKDATPIAQEETGYDPCAMEKRIHMAMNAALAKKGYDVCPANAPLQLHYHIILENKNAAPTETCDYESTTYWFRALTDPNDYEAGTLIVDMVDVARGSVVWRGRAVSVLDDEHSTDLQHELNRAMSRMLKTLPVSEHMPVRRVKKQALFARQ